MLRYLWVRIGCAIGSAACFSIEIGDSEEKVNGFLSEPE